MADLQSDEAARLRRSVRRLARVLNTTSADDGLTQTQSAVLGLIAARGPIGVRDVLDVEKLNPTMLSRVIGQLSDAGLVQRRPHPEDLRVVLFEPTADGRQAHDLSNARRAALVADGLDRLSDQQRSALTEALGALEALADAVEENAQTPRTGRVGPRR